jgi:hypothetical protein
LRRAEHARLLRCPVRARLLRSPVRARWWRREGAALIPIAERGRHLLPAGLPALVLAAEGWGLRILVTARRLPRIAEAAGRLSGRHPRLLTGKAALRPSREIPRLLRGTVSLVPVALEATRLEAAGLEAATGFPVRLVPVARIADGLIAAGLVTGLLVAVALEAVRLLRAVPATREPAAKRLAAASLAARSLIAVPCFPVARFPESGPVSRSADRGLALPVAARRGVLLRTRGEPGARLLVTVPVRPASTSAGTILPSAILASTA